MGTFGDRLRREREMRGISLDEIATATKISTRNLRALEDEKFKQLPGGIFNKGFVRAYAKFLGIDEEQMVAEYVAASQDSEAARDQKLRQDLSKVEFRHEAEERREISLEPKSQWGTIAAIVLIAATVFGGYKFYQKKKLEHQMQAHSTLAMVTEPARQAQVPPVAPPSMPDTVASATPDARNNTSAATGQPQTAPVPSDITRSASQKLPGAAVTPNAAPLTEAEVPHPADGPIDVKIHATQDCWVSITADGRSIMKGTLTAASEKAVRAKDQVVVVLGNAGGVEVSYNGKPVENLGTDVKRITFTPSGYE